MRGASTPFLDQANEHDAFHEYGVVAHFAALCESAFESSLARRVGMWAGRRRIGASLVMLRMAPFALQEQGEVLATHIARARGARGQTASSLRAPVKAKTLARGERTSRTTAERNSMSADVSTPNSKWVAQRSGEAAVTSARKGPEPENPRTHEPRRRIHIFSDHGSHGPSRATQKRSTWR